MNSDGSRDNDGADGAVPDELEPREYTASARLPLRWRARSASRRRWVAVSSGRSRLMVVWRQIHDRQQILPSLTGRLVGPQWTDGKRLT